MPSGKSFWRDSMLPQTQPSFENTVCVVDLTQERHCVLGPAMEISWFSRATATQNWGIAYSLDLLLCIDSQRQLFELISLYELDSLTRLENIVCSQ